MGWEFSAVTNSSGLTFHELGKFCLRNGFVYRLLFRT